MLELGQQTFLNGLDVFKLCHKTIPFLPSSCLLPLPIGMRDAFNHWPPASLWSRHRLLTFSPGSLLLPASSQINLDTPQTRPTGPTDHSTDSPPHVPAQTGDFLLREHSHQQGSHPADAGPIMNCRI